MIKLVSYLRTTSSFGSTTTHLNFFNFQKIMKQLFINKPKLTKNIKDMI